MSDNTYTVSAIICFLNAEKFIREAIESVLAQDWSDWELLLVDDGSTDGSATIAREYSSGDPERIRYIEHPGHANRGVAASRNLGVENSTGRYLAFLDADDVWLPHKLWEQVAILEAQPEVAMVFGRDRFWFSWVPENDEANDYEPTLGPRHRQTYHPPDLLPLLLTGRISVPCPSGILVRKDALKRAGGFEESFRGPHLVYEDQAFYAKLLISETVVAEDACWLLYRQHPESSCSQANSSGGHLSSRRFFLDWLEGYLSRAGVRDESVLAALGTARWRLDHPHLAATLRGFSKVMRTIRS